jgi:hypothetical protein
MYWRMMLMGAAAAINRTSPVSRAAMKPMPTQTRQSTYYGRGLKR